MVYGKQSGSREKGSKHAGIWDGMKHPKSGIYMCAGIWENDSKLLRDCKYITQIIIHIR